MELTPGKEHLVHKRFPLPKGCSVKSFSLREIDGEDEREAGRFLAARKETIDDEATAVFEEQVRISIIGVNNEAVAQPYTGMNKWSTKTRRCLYEAWGMLNSLDKKEVASFLDNATDLGGEETPGDVEVLTEAQLEAATAPEA